MVEGPSKTIEVFYSYASQDELLRDKLEKHLSILKRQGLISSWHNREIHPGREWAEEIDAHLNTAHIILLLISSDFLASDYCYDIEMKRALERHRAKEAHVIPIILRPVDWRGASFEHLQALPIDGEPVTSWRNRDQAFLNIAQGIRKVVKELTSESVSSLWLSDDATGVLLPQGTPIYIYNVHSNWVVDVAWSPDGRRIASTGGDGTVRVWGAAGNHLLTYRMPSGRFSKLGLTPTGYVVAWSPDNACIASAGDGKKVYVWDAATGRTISVYREHSGLLPKVYAVAWSPDGRSITSACSATGTDRTVHLWKATTGQTLRKYDTHSHWMPNFSVFSLSWSSDGRHIAVGTWGKIWVWNVETGQLSTYGNHSDAVVSVAWSPGDQLIASCAGQEVSVWNTVNGKSLACSPGHSDRVRGVKWSPDGLYIASASNDRTVKIWNALTGDHIFTYSGHSAWTTAIAWSPDGTQIASASHDGTIQVWQAI